MPDDLDAIVDHLFEVGILAKTPRSGFYFLGSGEQSVAEHTNRVVYIGYTLAMMRGNVDLSKILQMCLWHDIAETRVSDLNHVHQRYTARQEHKAVDDLTATLPYGKHIRKILKEYEERKTEESLLAKDADTLEFILALKEQMDTGHHRAKMLFPRAIDRLRTDEGKQLAKRIQEVESDRWWFAEQIAELQKSDE